jgi:N-acetyl sugar amidotransferase
MARIPLRVLNNLRRCVRCLLPETHETIVFDEEGVCNVCRQIEVKQGKIDWAARERELIELIESYRGRASHDCIVPFSGGKDSTFTLYELVTRYRVRPLVVSFDHGFMRPTTLENNERTIKKLGVDFLKFRPNWKVVQKLMLESLERKGDFCWHCHTGIFSYPMQIAVKFKIPLLLWGEPSAEYTSYYDYDAPEEVDERRFNRYINLGITAEDMVGMLDGTVTARDLEPFTYPSVAELRAIGCRSVCLGSYIPWDVKRHVEIIKRELGWQENDVEGVPDSYRYEKIECAMQGVRDYLRFIKRGYGRTNHLMALDLRNGRISLDEAVRLIERNDGKRPASLDVFLEYVGISEAEFMEIATRHAVSPYVHDPSKVARGEELWDQKLWDRS